MIENFGNQLKKYSSLEFTCIFWKYILWFKYYCNMENSEANFDIVVRKDQYGICKNESNCIQTLSSIDQFVTNFNVVGINNKLTQPISFGDSCDMLSKKYRYHIVYIEYPFDPLNEIPKFKSVNIIYPDDKLELSKILKNSRYLYSLEYVIFGAPMSSRFDENFDIKQRVLMKQRGIPSSAIAHTLIVAAIAGKKQDFSKFISLLWRVPCLECESYHSAL